MNNDSNILSHFFNVVKMIKKNGTFSHFFKKKMFPQPYASPTTILMYKVIM